MKIKLNSNTLYDPKATGKVCNCFGYLGFEYNYKYNQI